MSDIPNVIYLQYHGDGAPDDVEGEPRDSDVTWCCDQIYKSDIRYVRDGGPAWIAIDERLPERGEMVVWGRCGRGSQIGHMFVTYDPATQADVIQYEDGWGRTGDWTHWCEYTLPTLPTPPMKEADHASE